MFRHHGKHRTLSHNLKAASLLSFIAGFVNVVGFLAVQKLTTNVTGHFAFFVDEFFRFQFSKSIIYLLYILSFLLGSFVSNFIIEIVDRTKEKNIFFLPVLIEVFILALLGAFGQFIVVDYPDAVALSLLFTMGLQNSLITTLSNTMVRTTHLTGLFTDLGIELSQLFFHKTPDHRKKLFGSIRLRARIIFFFFLGGSFAGLIYNKTKIYSLVIGAMILFIGLIYDRIKYKYITWKHNTHK
ncbi:MAG: hypothetical protein RLZ56_1175 [Bacteroidota bacterium]|jgi:uncharacterized membrane protein YoaK (UPF0700 family)